MCGNEAEVYQVPDGHPASGSRGIEVDSHPWTAVIPLRRSEGSLFEYACHEGNHGMMGILSGARAEERAAAEAAAQESR